MKRMRSSSLFLGRRDSTVGMVLALLISISLAAARVYEINSCSSRVQEVADAAALAAENNCWRVLSRCWCLRCRYLVAISYYCGMSA